MPFSVGSNWDSELVERIVEFPEVHDLYATSAKNVVGGGRPYRNLPKVTNAEMESHMRKVRDAGLSFSFLLNSPSMGGREFVPETMRQVMDTVQWALDSGANYITVAIPYLIELIKERFPDAKIKASYNAKIKSVDVARSFADLGADVICVEQSIHRNFPLLEAIADSVDIPIQVICTVDCLAGCPNMSAMYHMNNTCTLSSTRKDVNKNNRHSVSYCISWCHLMKVLDPERIIKAGFIRPEDLHHYEAVGINQFKLDTRVLTTDHIIDRVRAYSDRRWDGDLKHLLSVFPIGFKTRVSELGQPERKPEENEAFEGFFSLKGGFDFDEMLTIDNRALDGFMDRFVKKPCPPSCTNCSYCAQFAKKSLNWDEKQRWRLIDILQNYRTSLMAGER